MNVTHNDFLFCCCCFCTFTFARSRNWNRQFRLKELYTILCDDWWLVDWISRYYEFANHFIEETFSHYIFYQYLMRWVISDTFEIECIRLEIPHEKNNIIISTRFDICVPLCARDKKRTHKTLDKQNVYTKKK